MKAGSRSAFAEIVELLTSMHREQLVPALAVGELRSTIFFV